MAPKSWLAILSMCLSSTSCSRIQEKAVQSILSLDTEVARGNWLEACSDGVQIHKSHTQHEVRAGKDDKCVSALSTHGKICPESMDRYCYDKNAPRAATVGFCCCKEVRVTGGALGGKKKFGQPQCEIELKAVTDAEAAIIAGEKQNLKAALDERRRQERMQKQEDDQRAAALAKLREETLPKVQGIIGAEKNTTIMAGIRQSMGVQEGCCLKGVGVHPGGGALDCAYVTSESQCEPDGYNALVDLMIANRGGTGPHPVRSPGLPNKFVGGQTQGSSEWKGLGNDHGPSTVLTYIASQGAPVNCCRLRTSEGGWGCGLMSKIEVLRCPAF